MRAAYDGCVQYPAPGHYIHFKHPDRVYEVLGIGRHSETGEDLVVYRAVAEDDLAIPSLWVRPAAMFFETVDRDGYRGPRFRPVAETTQRGLPDTQ
jgi:hypothetical protein